MPITTLKDVCRTERSAKPSSSGVGVSPSPVNFLSEALRVIRALQEKNYLCSILCQFPSHFKHHLAFCLYFTSYRIFIKDENEFRILELVFSRSGDTCLDALGVGGGHLDFTMLCCTGHWTYSVRRWPQVAPLFREEWVTGF